MATYVISDSHGQYNMVIEQVFLIMQKKQGGVSFADYDVFVMEVGGGFFWDGGAKITLK